ncbi:MAG: single-stranded DNA-binding protein [Fibrobacter sp.]|nr:single-stranded DNA-binding protein [Fibrobacter sp.]
MAYLNSISIIGNLGKDANIAFSTSGRKCAKFPVACTERYTDGNGEKKERTEWFNIVCWGSLADVMERLSVKKGTCVYVGGKMTFRTYEDNNGNKKSVAELVASSVQILNARARAEQEGEEERRAQGESEDLPF